MSASRTATLPEMMPTWSNAVAPAGSASPKGARIAARSRVSTESDPSASPRSSVSSSTTSARNSSALLPPLHRSQRGHVLAERLVAPRAPRSFVLPLRERPERKVEDIRRMPVVECAPPAAGDGVRAEANRDRGIGAVRRLEVRSVRARRVVERCRRGHPHDHALGEGGLIVGSGCKVEAQPEHDPVRLRHGREYVLQHPAARHPELVRVRVYHPVGAVLHGREPRHVRPPRAVAHLALDRDPPEVALAGVPLEDLRRAVHRLVIGRNDEVDARVPGGTRSGRQRCRPRRARRASARASCRAKPPAGTRTLLERVDAPSEVVDPALTAYELGLGEGSGVELVHAELPVRPIERPGPAATAHQGTEGVAHAHVHDQGAL